MRTGSGRGGVTGLVAAHAADLAQRFGGLPLRLVGQYDDAIADLVHLGQVEARGRDPGQERLP